MSKVDRVTFVVGVAVFLVTFAPRVGAQRIKQGPVRPIAQVAGSVTFKEYCTVCHGIGGKGDGPAAKALRVPPADLTQIAKRHEGRFPDAEAAAIIKGESERDAHGTREMPMWGPVFRNMDNSPVADLRVNNLVRYLRSIQEK